MDMRRLARALSSHFTARGRMERRLARTPRVSLGELQEGVVGRVVGIAGQLDEALEAPVSGRACVYYRIKIDEQITGIRRTLAREERATLFTLSDGTGRAIIDPTRCMVDLDEDGNNESGFVAPPNARQTALMTRFNISSSGLLEYLTNESRFARYQLADRNLVFHEAVIAVGETIAILGSGVREPDPDGQPDATYRGAPPTRLRMASRRNRPMLISDNTSTTG